jgi:hypothetical protein
VNEHLTRGKWITLTDVIGNGLVSSRRRTQCHYNSQYENIGLTDMALKVEKMERCFSGSHKTATFDESVAQMGNK